MRDFNSWLNTMRECINDFNYYVNFEKVYENASKYRIELNLLNSLIGSNRIAEDFRNLVEDYPTVLRCIPELLAVRQKEIYAQNGTNSNTYVFDSPSNSLDDYCEFMEMTGLFDLISNHIINNLYDYTVGIETGLDSNGRKNRGGAQMEHLVKNYLEATGVEFYEQMFASEVESRWGLDLSALTDSGTSTKRWDFVARANNHVYLIETNFYASGGSKLNETSRSYKMIAEEANATEDVSFVWITDGQGWKSARRNLEETFNVLPTLYNINDLENGALAKLFLR